MQLDSFYNDGTGWICRQCERQLESPQPDSDFPSRIFEEGEAEAKQPRLASLARAKWTDATRRMLTCPRCGISEFVEKS
jgi:hypothetical protein